MSITTPAIISGDVCTTTTAPDPQLRLRIVNVDHYMAEPNVRFDDLYSQFRQCETKRVPVLRVFGTTDDGRKVCLHVHRVYPYLSVKFDATADSANDNDNYEFAKQQFTRQLVTDLESRLMPRRTRTATKDSPSDHFIYDIQEVKAIPFYGYHESHERFLKIYFYNPWTVQKSCEHLLSGQVMDRTIQPYQSHIPYTLQFFIDNNLYGMSFLDAKRVIYRRTESAPDGVDYSDIEPMSSCEIECDIDLNDIMNKDVALDNQRLPGLETIWRDALNRCKDSQEVLHLKGVPSQERTGVTVNERESMLLQKLYDGLAKLDLKLDDSQCVATQSSFGDQLDDNEFADLIINCVDNATQSQTHNQIVDTIEEVIKNSQEISINRIIEEVIHNSQNEIISQTIENVIEKSCKSCHKKTKPKREVRKGRTSRKKLILLSDNEDTDASTEIDDTEHESNVVMADATTQTDIADDLDDSMDDSLLNVADGPVEDIVCDCDSDECCDQCCDRGSDQCECDCENCEYEKDTRIPQLDGAFDSDDSGSNFSPAYKDDSGDSDFAESSKRSKKKSAKKRPQNSRSRAAAKRKKTRASDDSDVEVIDTYAKSRSPPTRRGAARKTLRSPSPLSDNDDLFKSSSGRTIKSSKQLSSRLFDQLKPTSSTRNSRDNGSPIHMSFSESEGSDKETKGSSLSFLGMGSPKSKKKTKSRDIDDNRSDRSITPYLSHESEDEKPPKTRPGPKFTKASVPARPGPKSSKSVAPKPGPKSSKTAARPGPKSSKIGPKSSKKDDISSDIESDLYSNDYSSYGSTSRSRRSGAKGVNYDDEIERTSSLYSNETKSRTTAKRKPANRKNETQKAIESIFPYLDSTDNVDYEDDLVYKPKKANDYLSDILSANLQWRSFEADIVQIDEDYYDPKILDSIGKESLVFKSTPDYIIRPYLDRYSKNQEYWEAVKAEVEDEMNGGGRSGGPKSKGALKAFYTQPQLNDRHKSPEPKRSAPKPGPKSSAPKPGPKSSAPKPGPKSLASRPGPKSSKASGGAKKTNNSKPDELTRLIDEASYIIDKPLGKRGASSAPTARAKVVATTAPKRPAPKAKATPTPAVKKSAPKRDSSYKSKSSASKAKGKSRAKVSAKSSARPSRSRVPRGVTSETVFNTISIPFYESDLRVLTDLTGYKKKNYLKSLCDTFELEIEKMPKRLINKYMEHKFNPFIFENIYYNDYSGILPNEMSQFTQDVLITTKELINTVVSVSQCVDSLLNGAQNEVDPKPMILPIEDLYDSASNVDEDRDDWNYNNSDEDSQDVVGIAVDEFGVAIGAVEKTNGVNEDNDKVYENGIQGADDPLSQALMKTFGDSDDNNSNDGKANGADSGDEVDANENHNESQDEDNVNDIRNKDVEQQSDNEVTEQNNKVNEEVEQSCGDKQYSPVAAPTDQYSNQSPTEPNATEYQSNQYQEEQEDSGEEEEDDDQSQSNGAVNLMTSSQCMDPNVERVGDLNPLRQFRMSSNFSSQMYGYNEPQNVSQPYHQNPLQNPIVPTLPLSQNVSQFQNPNLFAAQQTWPQNMPPVNQMPAQSMQYNMPNVGTTAPPPPQQPDCEFDYSYMNYNPFNPNIPQFDGIFDDDSFHSEGNQFNCGSNDDEALDQLSQGSRSEEMSVNVGSAKRKIADVLEEALLPKNGGHKVAKDERYGHMIDGVVVKIAKSLSERCLRQLGREKLTMNRLTRVHSHTIGYEFTRDDCKSFYKTSLVGTAKRDYLQSLCNKNFNICLNRLNFNDFKHKYQINTPYKTQFISVSSLIKFNQFSKQNDFNNYYHKNEHKVKSNVDSNASTRALKDRSKLTINTDIEMPDEIPESPLNDMTDTNADGDNVNDEIYSFYSDKTLSPNFTQSTISSQISSQSVCMSHTSSPVPTTSSYRQNMKQHSTPMDSQKCKPFSQTLNDSTKKEFDFGLTCGSADTSGPQSLVTNNKPVYYRNTSIIEGPTLSNVYAFSSVDETVSPDTVAAEKVCQFLTTMSVEIHVSTRGKLNPDPNTDAIEVIFYSILRDLPANDSSQSKYTTGLIIVEPDVETIECSISSNTVRTSRKRALHTVSADHNNLVVNYVDDEIILLMKFVEIVKQCDPDIIVGYKVDTLSWGYIMKRANVLNMSIMTALSRINDDRFSRNVEGVANVKCELCGRITLNLWSILRHEVTLKQYNYENVHFHVLHERVPAFSFEKLTQLYANRYNQYNRRRVLDYYLTRAVGSLRFLDKLDFVAKNSELARLFGIQFHEVYNRGSQFRVESIMLRMTRLFDLIPVSPSHRQVHSQRAPEFIPLILEPNSKYYCDPVVVLDFQSLYPSMMIAYNYCYSTCLGKVDQLIQSNTFTEFGCIGLDVKKQLLYKYRNNIHISPNGVVFLKDYVRKGILPKMLDEILETRIMVKNAMKMNNKKQNPNKALHRKLDARQLGLKMISNFTYGYTSANFSGRMPCVDIADSIVAKGRETLERAINLVNNTPEWGGKVVYGDTDSLFIHFPGLSKEEAFKRGYEIADVITQSNPKPVKLKFEKVYLPCVLQTKKRYVGFSYESVDQQKPVFDAKGIETVRRDTCPAVAKMLEKSLRILFDTNDVNGVKHYLFRQFQKILDGRVNILDDFVFAREYRGADSYSDKSHVPSKEIAKRKVTADPYGEPKTKERVPYVVICGAPNEPVYKLIKEPLDLINDPSLRLNSEYYINRAIIPALNRVFEMMGHNVNDWYREMPKRIHYNRYQYLLGKDKVQPKTIPQFFNKSQCIVCDTNSKGQDFCDDCRHRPHESVRQVCSEIRSIHMNHQKVLSVCKDCSGCTDPNIQCQSIECPNLYRYHQSKLDLMNANYLSNVLNKYF